MRGRWQILVVDDDVAMTEPLAASLREDGYTVETAASGRQAIERVDLKQPCVIVIAAAELLELVRESARQRPTAAAGRVLPTGLTLREMEKEYIAATLVRLQGNVKGAAEALGIDRSTLYEKIKRYEIPR